MGRVIEAADLFRASRRDLPAKFAAWAGERARLERRNIDEARKSASKPIKGKGKKNGRP
jgi:hypothetical protein